MPSTAAFATVAGGTTTVAGSTTVAATTTLPGIEAVNLGRG